MHAVPFFGLQEIGDKIFAIRRFTGSQAVIILLAQRLFHRHHHIVRANLSLGQLLRRLVHDLRQILRQRQIQRLKLFRIVQHIGIFVRLFKQSIDGGSQRFVRPPEALARKGIAIGRMYRIAVDKHLRGGVKQHRRLRRNCFLKAHQTTGGEQQRGLRPQHRHRHFDVRTHVSEQRLRRVAFRFGQVERLVILILEQAAAEAIIGSPIRCPAFAVVGSVYAPFEQGRRLGGDLQNVG